MRYRLAFLACLASLASLADAQSEPSADAKDTTIVVTGKVEPPAGKDVYEQAQAVTRLQPNLLHEEALARFEKPLCPAVLGLRDDYATAILKRIRTTARRLKLSLADGNCEPNLLIAFVDDGQSFLAALQRRHPLVFQLVEPAERAELLTRPAPVRVFTEIDRRTSGAGGTGAAGIPLPIRHGKQQRMSPWGQLDRKSLPTRRDIELSLVLYNKEATLGLTLEQLADYATMRGLTHTRAPGGEQPMATILSLFDDRGARPGAAEALTTFDIAYLRTAYTDAPNAPAVRRLLSVRREAQSERSNGRSDR